MTQGQVTQNTSQPLYANGSSPTYTVEQVADYLTDGFWEDNGESRRKFDVSSGGTLTYSLQGVDSAAKWFIEKALSAWTVASGLKFQEVGSGQSADIDFIDDYAGAFSNSDLNPDNTISKSYVNVHPSWYANEKYLIDSYSYQTFLHEIGHALGLGHAGNYNGTGDFSTEAHYKNDSWQMTAMSYFSQVNNPFVDADLAFTLTPMIADIYAIQDLYGKNTSANLGNTVYGENSNAQGSAKEFSNTGNNWWVDYGLEWIATTMTVNDSGGWDTFDFSGEWYDQKIDLRQGAISDVNGEKGNLIIALGTVIESAKGGSGDDVIIGNSSLNHLFGDYGNDRLYGGNGGDRLYGETGNDRLYGGDGADKLVGGTGSDRLFGDRGEDALYGGKGDDKLDGGVSNDLLVGGDGKDELTGGLGADIIRAGAGADRLVGNQSNDKLFGYGGTDRLNGGNGNDLLWGGKQADTFIFGAGIDRIKDFSERQDDKIRLDASELGGRKSIHKLLKQNTKIVKGDAVITFKTGDKLIIENVDNKMDLVDDISFF